MVYTFPYLGEHSQMPWKECEPTDERLRFITRLLEGEKMAPVCREFDISRVTGYKIFERYKANGTPLSAARALNGLWCADYKGEFLLGNQRYCYPLTITDYRSRDLLACEGLESTKPAAFNALQQQERFDAFIGVYNQERPQEAPGGAARGHPRGRRPPLAGQLPRIRSRVLRSRSGPGGARSQSLRTEHSVNHVSGMRCKPCDRNAP